MFGEISKFVLLKVLLIFHLSLTLIFAKKRKIKYNQNFAKFCWYCRTTIYLVEFIFSIKKFCILFKWKFYFFSRNIKPYSPNQYSLEKVLQLLSIQKFKSLLEKDSQDHMEQIIKSFNYKSSMLHKLITVKLECCNVSRIWIENT